MNKNWIMRIFILVSLIAITISSVQAYYCYQESANVSNQTGIDGNCGLNYTGKYDYSELSSSSNATLPFYMFDGNHSSFGSFTYSSPVSVSAYINYSKPNVIIIPSSIWRLWYYDGLSPNSIMEKNITIPPDCMGSGIVLRIQHTEDGAPTYHGENNVSCFNGTVWNLLNSSRMFNNLYFYEEAIWWGIFNTLNVSAKEYNGLAINNFSVNDNGILYSTTNGLIQLYLENNSVHDVFIDAPSFAYANTTITSNSSAQSYQFSLYPSNSVNVSIFDTSNNRITQNISLMLSNSVVKYYTTTAGYIFLEGLDVGTNQLTFSSVNYSSNVYTISITNRTTQSMNVYLTPVSGSQNLSLCFYNTNGVYIPNLLVFENLLSGSGYLLSQSQFTDINGKVIFAFNPSNYYRYNWSSTSYAETFFNLNPPLNSQTLADGCNYDITLISSTAAPTYETIKVSGNASFNNVTRIITLDYISLNSSYSKYYLNIFKTTNGVNVLICNSSNAVMVSSITCNVTGYVGQVFVRGTADGSVFYGSWMSLGNPSSFAGVLSIMDAAFICGFIMLVVVCGGLAFGTAGAGVSGVIGLLAIFWLGMFTPVTAVIVIIDTVITIVILTSLKPRGT